MLRRTYIAVSFEHTALDAVLFLGYAKNTKWYTKPLAYSHIFPTYRVMRRNGLITSLLAYIPDDST